MREFLLGLLVAVPFGLGASAVLSDGSDGKQPLFRFADPEIVESSGLVVAGGLVLTVNDSGDAGRVFAVDPASGETVGVTHWAGEPEDVEALAPAGPGEVWVGDIGDNARQRESVRVVRVPVGRGDRSVTARGVDLRYPDGAHDAEALLSHPRTGRLYVATKDVFGGRMYAAPARRGDGTQQLEPVGQVMPLVTDGAFLPDGRHVVLRDYARAVVLTFPGLEEVGQVRLPSSPQGEGIAVTPEGTLLVSSEGMHAAVHRFALPRAVARAVAGGSTGPGASPTSPSSVPPSAAGGGDRSASAPEAQPQPVRRTPWPWALGGLVGVAMLVVLLRSLRPR